MDWLIEVLGYLFGDFLEFALESRFGRILLVLVITAGCGFVVYGFFLLFRG